jgi:hypothetical protein
MQLTKNMKLFLGNHERGHEGQSRRYHGRDVGHRQVAADPLNSVSPKPDLPPTKRSQICRPCNFSAHLTAVRGIDFCFSYRLNLAPAR